MKILTITSHDVYNYGASLQAYALMTFLKNNGHDVRIIDYHPDYEFRRYSFTHIHKGTLYYRISELFPILRRFIAFLYNRRDIKFLGRKKAFDNFTHRHLKLTSKVYHNIEELNEDKPIADVYIAGSDQIWNTEHGKGKDPAFYLDFVHDKQKCISYAASFATEHIVKEYENFVKSCLNNFSSISVRELTGVDIAKSLGYDVKRVLDPTFLLSKVEWECMFSTISDSVKRKCEKKYVLLYNFVKDDKVVDDFAIKCATEKDYNLISINDGYIKQFADININNAGPIEFLYYIYNAELIISNSFHATVFSIIFQKNFYTFPLKGATSSSRMKDLLKLLGLEYRFKENGRDIDIETIQWNSCETELAKQILESKEWLLNAINKK